MLTPLVSEISFTWFRSSANKICLTLPHGAFWESQKKELNEQSGVITFSALSFGQPPSYDKRREWTSYMENKQTNKKIWKMRLLPTHHHHSQLLKFCLGQWFCKYVCPVIVTGYFYYLQIPISHLIMEVMPFNRDMLRSRLKIWFGCRQYNTCRVVFIYLWWV